ncbi:hypothetical protein GCM10007301_54930 [Azorhizobium oxalatiphilum]|uniref:YncI copper-binding domain-containing protein n=1 Tax=Azorhizobium oxalatiphilum TaxID=980631 RepID=A0A917CHX4_9HYPH|nr:DUF1775 domain-containing protein [Azorhizobium oxalatiphilum]GGF88006.1 hypothetical protein GCM10007301_54930 [Azorhizobium oxalatiphilum]
MSRTLVLSRTFARPLAVALFSLVAGSASAHIVLEQKTAQPGSSYKGTLRVTHGCGESATTALRVTIPEGVVGVRPQPKAGWTIALESGPYAKAYPMMHGKPATEGVKTITWSGGNLPNAYYDEFVFVASLSADVAGKALAFPVLQTCENGSADWAEATVEGQPVPSHPAPVLKVAAASSAPMAGMGSAAVKVGDIQIDLPWMRATPGGAKVAGGYLKLTNTGSAPDKLVSIATDIAGKAEVHEMSMANGVMTMRAVSGGLELAPGKSVELAPGGFHLMMMDLKRPLKEGDKVQATLVFEKAGKVDVTFPVRGIGAGAPAAGGAMGEHQH